MRADSTIVEGVRGTSRALPAAARRVDREDDVAAGNDALTAVSSATSVRTGADYHRAALRYDARRDAATPAAAMLADLIHRMGGANTSAARGAYVNLRV